jgi:hypothetical protein
VVFRSGRLKRDKEGRRGANAPQNNEGGCTSICALGIGQMKNDGQNSENRISGLKNAMMGWAAVASPHLCTLFLSVCRF